MAANSYFEVLGGFLPQHLKIGISLYNASALD